MQFSGHWLKLVACRAALVVRPQRCKSAVSGVISIAIWCAFGPTITGIFPPGGREGLGASLRRLCLL